MNEILSTSGVEGVADELWQVYSSATVEEFRKLMVERPDMSLGEALQYITENPTNQQTDWFREGNLRRVAMELIGTEVDRAKKIAVIGCSSGKEVYSLKHWLCEVGKDEGVSVLGIDVSPERVEEAREGKYRMWAERMDLIGVSDKDLKRLVESGRFVDSGERWDHRVPTESGWIQIVKLKQERKPVPEKLYQVQKMVIMVPADEFKQGLEFRVHDIIRAPVAEKQDVVVMNNVLLHYPDKTRDRIMSNVIGSMREGALLAMESPMRPMKQGEEAWLRSHLNWRARVSNRFPLEPVKVPHAWGGEPRDWQMFYRVAKKSE